MKKVSLLALALIAGISGIAKADVSFSGMPEYQIETAKRELYEEIGATAKEFIYLGEFFPTVGYCEEIIYLYLAKDLKFTNRLHLDADEFLNVKKYEYTKLLEMVKNNDIKDAKTVIGLLKCGDYLD